MGPCADDGRRLHAHVRHALVTDGVRWRLTDPDLVWRAWPGEQDVAVFSPRAGSVHLLTVSARNLLQELARERLTAAGIGRFIAADTGVDRGVVDEALPELMHTLRDAELIEPIEPADQ